MATYSKTPDNSANAAKARGSDLRVHFKNTHATAVAIRGMGLTEAKKYLEAVIAHKDIIPFRRHTGCVSRKAQMKKYNTTQGRYPEKSCRFVLGLLQNCKSNAESKGLDVEGLKITHIQVNRAMRGRRRTYRAHGRINSFMSSPCHIELIAEVRESPVKAAGEKKARKGGKVESGATAGHS